MRPGSLYASFQSKENLYIEALEMYALDHQQKFELCREQGGSFLEGLRLFFEGVVKPKGSPCVCMLGKAVSAFETEDLAVRARAESLMSSSETFFSEAVEKAAKTGELSPDCKPREVARFLMVQLMGLRCYADSCQHDSQLDTLIAHSVAAIEAVA